MGMGLGDYFADFVEDRGAGTRVYFRAGPGLGEPRQG